MERLHRISVAVALSATIVLLTACAGSLSEITNAPDPTTERGTTIQIASDVPGLIPSEAANEVLPNVAGVVNQVVKSVVTIQTSSESQGFFGTVPQEGAGTGFIISSDGYIVTNAHVVGNSDRVTVILPESAYDEELRFENARVVGRDAANDIAVVKIDAEDLPAAVIGRSENMPIGSWVIAIGNALGRGPSVTSGIISAVGQTLETGGSGCRLDNTIQTDAAINPGNSGGPLFNMTGHVIGINTAVQRAANGVIIEGVGFAISLDHALPIIQEIIETSSDISTQPWLGVNLGTIDSTIAAQFRLPTDEGVFVRPLRGQPAYNAGLIGDVVVQQIDGSLVMSARDAQEAIGAHVPGDLITLSGLTLRGQEFSITITLGLRCGS